MSSMTVLLIFTVGIISVWSEPIRVELERRDDGGQTLVQCLADGFSTVAQDMEGVTGMTQDEGVKEACKFFKEIKKCILNGINKYPPQAAPQILYLSAAYEYQHLFIAHQADMCKDVLYDDLKQVAIGSGALSKLEEVENKQYQPCVRTVLRDCLSEMVNSFQQQNNQVNPHFEYVECYKREAAIIPCKPPMLGAFLDNGDIMHKEWNLVKEGNY